jgi:chemotaxis protein MotB
VSKKKFQEIELAREGVMIEADDVRKKLTVCEEDNSKLLDQINELKGQIRKSELDLENEKGRRSMVEQELDYQKKTNTNLLDRLSDLSIISKTGAESIKQSLEAINEQNKYIKDLTGEIQVKDSINLALVMNLKRSLADINDEDVTIEVKKGVVYISISDRMLFKSGSSGITSQAEIVLGKIAKVLNDQKQLEILVEGHTDNVPIAGECVTDNWDLSVKRATTVVRTLQKKYGVDPGRMTAGGRAEYVPKASNENSGGRSMNRRTEIIVLPQLDQFFKLLEVPNPTTEGN